MGSVLTLSPGQEETFTLSHLGVEKPAFTVWLRLRDQEGNNYEFTSLPFEVTAEAAGRGRRGIYRQKRQGCRSQDGVICCIILNRADSGVLFYILRDSLPFFRKRKAVRRKAHSDSN